MEYAGATANSNIISLYFLLCNYIGNNFVRINEILINLYILINNQNKILDESYL